MRTDRPVFGGRRPLALDELFAEKAGRLVDHPGLGKLGRAAGTRELVAHQNCILVYDMADDLVRVLRVLHVARLWPPSRFDSQSH